jgi:hypothetical protein
MLSKRPGTRFTQVVLLNNQYEVARKKARLEQLSEKNKNKRELVLTELEEKKEERSIEELKKEYKRLNFELKKLKVLIQIFNNSPISGEPSDPVDSAQNSLGIE